MTPQPTNYTKDQLRRAITDCEKTRGPDVILLQAGGVYLRDVCRQLLAMMQQRRQAAPAVADIIASRIAPYVGKINGVSMAGMIAEDIVEQIQTFLRVEDSKPM